jgi:hypothetical protein
LFDRFVFAVVAFDTRPLLPLIPATMSACNRLLTLRSLARDGVASVRARRTEGSGCS